MKTYKTYKADPIVSEEEVDGVCIEISIPVREMKTADSLKEHEKLFDFEAQNISEALFNSLPQGVYDRLTIRMMERKVSSYIGKSGT